MNDILHLLGQLLGPIGTIFHFFFYLPVYNLLMLIFSGVHSFALSVIAITLVLRGALIPLTRKQLKSSREMQVLQPKLKELQQQFRGDPQRLMAEQRALYKEHGVSPVSGCLPLLVQMPFLYALYFSFYTVLPGKLGNINRDIYPFLPHLKQAPDLHFLWTNLGHPDPLHILPILAGFLTFTQLRMAMPVRKKLPGAQADATTQATGMMQYMMPLITIFIGWKFYSGLALYWAISTSFSAAQQYFINGKNWGSLFVGIPRMQHLVPEPKAPPAPAPRTTGRGGRALPAGGVAAAAVPAVPAQGGGLRGMWQQMRENMAAQQRLAQEARGTTPGQDAALATAEAGDGTGATNGATNGHGTNGRAGRDRRARPAKTGPTLVRTDATERAIRDATRRDELPERAIARSANGGNGAEHNGARNEQRNPGATSAQPAPSNGNGGGPRAGARKGVGKGAPSARARGARPKGGR